MKHPAILIALLGICGSVYSQDLDPATTKRIIDARNYIFQVQTVSPAKGSIRQLNTGDYDLVVAGDSVIAYLPYFGRAYSAPFDSEGGIKFVSARSGYKIKQKKNRWEITIEPGDVEDVQEMYLDIYENGRATLRVTSTNRQPISFNGYIIEGKDRPRRAF